MGTMSYGACLLISDVKQLGLYLLLLSAGSINNTSMTPRGKVLYLQKPREPEGEANDILFFLLLCWESPFHGQRMGDIIWFVF